MYEFCCVVAAVVGLCILGVVLLVVMWWRVLGLRRAWPAPP
jgi:hypothetical protein